MKGHLKQRHERCKAALFKLLTDLGATVELEPKLKRAKADAMQHLRADLLVTTATGKKFIDLSIVCPAGQENVKVNGSHKNAHRACEAAANAKILKYTGMLPENSTDSDFVPLIFETYGAINKAGTSWLKAICSELSTEPESAFDHVMNVMSATLQMANGQVDVTGMSLHRHGQRAVKQSKSQAYQSHVMALLQQYVSGITRLNWKSEVRKKSNRGSMREANL
jgi:hypothetical protein